MTVLVAIGFRNPLTRNAISVDPDTVLLIPFITVSTELLNVHDIADDNTATVAQPILPCK